MLGLESDSCLLPAGLLGRGTQVGARGCVSAGTMAPGTFYQLVLCVTESILTQTRHVLS